MYVAAKAFAELSLGLTEAVGLCRAGLTEKAVHRLRTSTRRLEALLHKTLADHRGAKGLQRAAGETLELLRKLRRKAGAVRDLDVHRGMAAELRRELLRGRRGPARKAWEEEFEALEEFLAKGRRQEEKTLARAIEKLEGRLQESLLRTGKAMAALAGGGPAPRQTAERWAGRTGRELRSLTAESLHDYRKRTKAARYLAELEPADARARALARRLHGVQDRIGLWHDWEMLRGEAAKALGRHAQLGKVLDARAHAALLAATRSARRLAASGQQPPAAV